MTPTDSDNNPDKRTRAKPDNYLENWIERQALTEAMIPLIGKWHRSNVRILLYGNPLMNLSVIEIMQLHRRVREVENNELSEYETSMVLASINKLDVGPSQIDIGILAAGYMFDDKGIGIDEFIQDQIKDVIGKHDPILNQSQDLVLFGFGRIGRLITRLLLEDSGAGETFKLKAVVTRKKTSNDLLKRAELIRKDSVHGRFKGTIRVDEEENALIMNGNVIKFINSDDPGDIDYSKYGIKDALLIDNTGISSDEKGLSIHLKNKEIKKVLLTAPVKEGLKNIVYGVNHDDIDDSDKIIGAASCTTNAIVPLLSAIDNEFKINNGHVETVHSYTNDQNLIDNFHMKSRRGRAAALNMVITETGAAKAVAKVLPDLKGKLTANAIRVPTPNVSLAILKLYLDKSSTLEDFNDFLKKTANHSLLKDQIDISVSTENVSSDFVGSKYAGVIDGQSTIVNGKNVIVYVWYDNEIGYCAQLLKVIKKMSGIKYKKLPNFL
ncbi:MAG: glyceraldehyde-3-phosphate dehydrogenase [Gammaproteobacteria bacterium]